MEIGNESSLALNYPRKNLRKSLHLKIAVSRPGDVLENYIKPDSYGKVREMYFTNAIIDYSICDSVKKSRTFKYC